MLPNTTSTTYCLMAFQSQNSTASQPGELQASAHWQITRVAGQSVRGVVYCGAGR